jgi:hypothetical protein
MYMCVSTDYLHVYMYVYLFRIAIMGIDVDLGT